MAKDKVDRSLIPGETVIKRMRPHWAILAKPVLIALALSVVLYFALSKLHSGLPNHSAIIDKVLFVVYLVFLLGWAGVPFIKWATTRYVFTDQRIITKTGWLRTSGEVIPLSKVNSLTLNKDLLERLYGAGSFIVESAARNEVEIKHVRHPDAIQEKLYEFMNKKGD